MSNETCVGFMAVVAVSSSVVFLAHQLHRRLATDYMKKIELIYGYDQKPSMKKKVRFAPDVIEPSSNNKEYRRRHVAAFSQVH
ncbi:uncharacterized protein LOC144572531 [Carex rostrata]